MIIINPGTTAENSRIAYNLKTALKKIEVMILKIGQESLSAEALDHIDDETLEIASLVSCCTTVADRLASELNDIELWVEKNNINVSYTHCCGKGEKQLSAA